MGYLIRVPIDDDQTGGHLLVEADGPRGDLGPAGGSGHGTIVQASQNPERSIDDVAPTLRKEVERLGDVAPGEFTVAFRLTVGAKGRIPVAKGAVEAHFRVTTTTCKTGESYPPATDVFSHFRSRPETADPVPGWRR